MRFKLDSHLYCDNFVYTCTEHRAQCNSDPLFFTVNAHEPSESLYRLDYKAHVCDITLKDACMCKIDALHLLKIMEVASFSKPFPIHWVCTFKGGSKELHFNVLSIVVPVHIHFILGLFVFKYNMYYDKLSSVTV